MEDGAISMLFPLLDLVNHSFDPNCIFRPVHHRVNDQSFVHLEALKDIKAGEQLLISYGNDLPNSHLI